MYCDQALRGRTGFTDRLQSKTVNRRAYAVARYCLLEDKRPTDWAGLYRAFPAQSRGDGRLIARIYEIFPLRCPI